MAIVAESKSVVAENLFAYFKALIECARTKQKMFLATIPDNEYVCMQHRQNYLDTVFTIPAKELGVLEVYNLLCHFPTVAAIVSDEHYTRLMSQLGSSVYKDRLLKREHLTHESKQSYEQCLKDIECVVSVGTSVGSLGALLNTVTFASTRDLVGYGVVNSTAWKKSCERVDAFIKRTVFLNVQ